MKEIIGYGFEIWFEGNCIRELSDYEIYDTEDEAREGALAEIDYIVTFEDGYNEGDRNDLEIAIIDIEEDEEW